MASEQDVGGAVWKQGEGWGKEGPYFHLTERAKLKRYQQQLGKASGEASGITRLEKKGVGRKEFRQQWSFLAKGRVFPRVPRLILGR